MSPLNQFAAGTLKVLFYPLLLLGDYTHKRRQSIRQGYLSLTPEPYFLSKARTRALTLPLPPETRNRQKTLDQSQCDLLNKLPSEVRQIIWKECLGGMTLHIDIRDRRLRRFPCSSPDPKLCHESCWTWYPRPNAVPKRQLLALLLSCRQVYSEAIDLTYSSNTFDMIFPESIVYLPDLVLPQRLVAIRSIHLQWTFTQPPQLPPYGKKGPRRDDWMWTKGWSNLVQMKRLSELRVEIRIPEGSEWALPSWTESEIAILQPLREVKVAGSFELILPFPSLATDVELEGLPCQIRRIGIKLISLEKKIYFLYMPILCWLKAL
ncbi:hypothetical protein BJ875DRAFT_210704 [Amylocarpus encephaloides]|uniref:DUF7730 domain-containing protein n=1 Tax=Amylocarpus encephaloides TaxID=45428 RepID=A0A9P8C935_9HELO|nr:hypothetical protein BJ875DRAFT_210704 [Amylocarpus encephaloides]